MAGDPIEGCTTITSTGTSYSVSSTNDYVAEPTRCNDSVWTSVTYTTSRPSEYESKEERKERLKKQAIESMKDSWVLELKNYSRIYNIPKNFHNICFSGRGWK